MKKSTVFSRREMQIKSILDNISSLSDIDLLVWQHSILAKLYGNSKSHIVLVWMQCGTYKPYGREFVNTEKNSIGIYPLTAIPLLRNPYVNP